MEITKLNINNIFMQFDKLVSSFIDASSIIYLKKINLMDCLSENIKLLAIKEIINETGFNNLNIDIYKHNIKKNISNDEKLVKCSIKEKLPIITEDKKVLNLAKKAEIEYYNSLMILNYLFYKDIINAVQYEFSYNILIDYAWYSNKILNFGKFIFKEILIKKNKLL